MKISDLSNNEQLDEAPAGALGQLAKRAGAGIAKAVPGMGNIAANLTGKADVGSTANAVYKKFNQYLGTQQKNVKTATGEDLANFLKNTYNYNQQKIPSGVLTKQQVNTIIMQMAKDGYAQMGANKSASSEPAGQTHPSKTATKNTTPAAKQSVAISSDVQAQIDALTPTEKKALVGILQK